jgi:hypothetical protein
MLICWLCSSILMLLMSYLWHGVLLNDYAQLDIPVVLYLGLSVIVYLILGGVLTFLYHYTQTHQMKYKGLLMGSCLGFFIYLIAFVLGVSFNQTSTIHVVVDFVWQMLEQGVGGAFIAVLFGFLVHMGKMNKAG